MQNTIVLDRVKQEEIDWPQFDSRNQRNGEMIRERLKVAPDRQKSYADMRRKDIRYEISEKVFLKVSPWKKVMRFGKNDKLSPRFIGPYEGDRESGSSDIHISFTDSCHGRVSGINNILYPMFLLLL